MFSKLAEFNDKYIYLSLKTKVKVEGRDKFETCF
jgi:hypothetical protein